MKLDGKYYALPTAVRSLALVWNKALLKEAGSAGHWSCTVFR
jgi:multiple sugar transport system substrate-binding protein